MVRSILATAARPVCEAVGVGHFSRPALNDLDRKLERYLTKRGGFFVEAGANDGFTQSNTYYLERIKGWKGLLIEGIPSLHAKAKALRPRCIVEHCALVPPELEGTQVEMTYGNLMSLVSGAMGSEVGDAAHLEKARAHDPESGSFKVRVGGRTLSSILDDHHISEVDFLSLDIEGYEAPALRGLDTRRHRPTYICVEARHLSEVDAVLLPRYERVDQLSAMDHLYRIRRDR